MPSFLLSVGFLPFVYIKSQSNIHLFQETTSKFLTKLKTLIFSAMWHFILNNYLLYIVAYMHIQIHIWFSKPLLLSLINLLISYKTLSPASVLVSKSARNAWVWSYCWALQEQGDSEALVGTNQSLTHLLKHNWYMLKKKI